MALTHEQHRAAVGQAVSFIRPRLIKGQTSVECAAALWNHCDLWISHDRFNHFNSGGTDERSFIGQGVEEFSEDRFCCE